MKPKKKGAIAPTAVILILVCGLVFFLCPLSFDASFDRILISYVETVFDNNIELSRRTAEFCFSQQDAEFEQIKQILKKYSYHYSIRTLFSGAGIHWIGPGYLLSIGLPYEDNLQNITITKSPYILIGSKVYRVGYCGNAKVLALGNELISVLALD